MSSTRFVLESHPAKLQIWIANGLDRRSARMILRRATYVNRSLVKTDICAFAAYLISYIVRFRRTKQLVCIDTAASRIRPASLVFRIDCDSRGPTLEITERGAYRYHGRYYAWLGSKHAPHSKTNKSLRGRRERLGRFAEDYRALHGFYPDDPRAAQSNKATYDPMHRRLQVVRTTSARRSISVTAAHARRRKRLAKLVSRQPD